MDIPSANPHIGHASQLMQIRRFRLESGPGAGLECVDVQNSAGLSLALLPDRALDIESARYRGVNLCCRRRGGPVGPGLSRGTFETDNSLGMMFTCGLENTGEACEHEGIRYPQHGSLAGRPAASVAVEETAEDGVPVATVSGRIEQNSRRGEYLTLERRYAFRDDRADIVLSDRVTNTGCASAAVLIMYHFNFGYPLLDENAEVTVDSASGRAKNRQSESALDSWRTVLPPQDAFPPQVIWHTLAPDAAGMASCSLRNPELGIAVRLEMDARRLPGLTQWRNFQKCEYVLGLEPCNRLPRTRAVLAESGELPMLEPGESVRFELALRASGIPVRT